MSRLPLTIVTAALAVAACDRASTQAPDANFVNEAPPANATNAINDSGAVAATATSDFATKAAVTDLYEIESSKLADQNGASEKTQVFAKEMITAHTATTAALKKALSEGNVAVTPPPALDAEHQAMVDRLKPLKGTAFDIEYRTQQMEVHQKALSLMQGYAANGDNPALKAFAAETAPKVQQHMTMLMAI